MRLCWNLGPFELLVTVDGYAVGAVLSRAEPELAVEPRRLTFGVAAGEED